MDKSPKFESFEGSIPLTTEIIQKWIEGAFKSGLDPSTPGYETGRLMLDAIEQGKLRIPSKQAVNRKTVEATLREIVRPHVAASEHAATAINNLVHTMKIQHFM